jgi:hypothetical protein
MQAFVMSQAFSRTLISFAAASLLFVVAAPAAHAGGQITLYITVPLGGNSPASGHVFGLRLDRTSTVDQGRLMNPDSPLNRRPLLDMQLGANSALRLELDRQLTWDINRQQWRLSSRPATLTLRLPARAAQP